MEKITADKNPQQNDQFKNMDAGSKKFSVFLL